MRSHHNLRKCLFRFVRDDETLVDFAFRIGVTSQALYSWMRGIAPRVETLERIAERLQVHPALLIWDDVPGNEFKESGEKQLRKVRKRRFV